MPPEQVILFIIGTVVILFGAYYVTYFVGMKATGQTRAGLKNRNISLLDRYAIARDKQFCIIEVAGKVYLIGVTNHTMTLLDTFDAAAFAKLTEDNRDDTPWNMTPVGMYGNKLTRKVLAFIAEKTGRIPPNSSTSENVDFSENLREAQEKSEPGQSEDAEEKPPEEQKQEETQPEDQSKDPEED